MNDHDSKPTSTSNDNNLPLSEANTCSSSIGTRRDRFTFRHRWFDAAIRADWERLAQPLFGKKLQVLEIGCYEGASTTWILDNLMSHPESSLTCIDTFEGGMEHQEADKTHRYELQSLESRFRANVAKCEYHASKLEVVKARSDEALLELRCKGTRFDLVYIDASHVAIDVLQDAVLSWHMLNLNGVMVFDDFRWKGYLEDCYNPRIAIQAFLHCVVQEVETTETEYQMWVTKVPNRIPATPNPDPEVYYWDENAGLKLHKI